MSGIGYRVSGIGMRVGCAAALLLVFASGAFAQHLRIFACAIGNDSSGAFMGGSTSGSGLYQSDDTGKTWKHLGWDNIKCYSMDMVQPSNGRILYMGTGLGVLRSTDYGEHWKQITDWRISEVMDVAVDQKKPDEIYLATAHGPWRTKNGGMEWQYVDGIDPPYCSRAIYSPDSMQLGDFVLGGEAGIFWRGPSDPAWQTTSLGPTRVRDISFASFQYRSSVGGHRGRGKSIPSNSNEGIARQWLVASERDGLYISTDGLRGFNGTAIKRQYFETIPLWCVAENGDERVVGGPEGSDHTQFGGDVALTGESREIKNVSSCIVIGAKRTSTSYSVETMLASLGQGVYTHHALPKLQIWRLKSFLVTP